MRRLGRGQTALGRVWGAEMPRKAGATDKGKSRSGGPERSLPPVGPVAVDPKGCVTIAIHAKPGSKQNAVTDLTAEAVSVAIAAPPSEGEANAELCRYLSRVLALRKSDVVLDKVNLACLFLQVITILKNLKQLPCLSSLLLSPLLSTVQLALDSLTNRLHLKLHVVRPLPSTPPHLWRVVWFSACVHALAFATLLRVQLLPV
ncbi:UPF0235 protein C15orf40 homolog isoform X1 [Manis javanica]|uniref:UPF0235 protein C15orf40 homolog isoform X1 n=1 Tax=Manis javanica TaxID=9974 RepID=UPI003C6D3AD8